ncbi:MAG TPA: TetR/AcrR family transcriptional regulator [Alphaproteobacteria bacterium]|nr:TetR/AcrR family transcriptional regulator [Alphaproteobacteria bacterium]
MGVSLDDDELLAERGARARTRKLMLETASALMQQGATPSVSDVAEAAGVSRATAYRYFPSQADLVHAVVEEALGPILDWESDSRDAAERVDDLLASSLPRIIDFEATFRAALKLSLEQWAQEQAGTLGEEPAFARGHRVELLQQALAPLRKTLPRKQFQRLAMALSLAYGVEALVVLKDIWGAGDRQAQDVARWVARALVKAAVSEAASKRRQLERARARR